jgi:cell division protein FtsL
MLRFFNIALVAGLIAAAVIVYDVKYSSTYEAQKVARLDSEIRKEREKIATLKAEWSALAAPDRIQRLALKYLGMKQLPVAHIGDFASLPERVQTSGDPIGDLIDGLPGQTGGKRDPIGNIIDKLESARQGEPETTGSIAAKEEPEVTGSIGDLSKEYEQAGAIEQDGVTEQDGASEPSEQAKPEGAQQ